MVGGWPSASHIEDQAKWPVFSALRAEVVVVNISQAGGKGGGAP